MAKPMKKEELRRPDGFVQTIDSAAGWMKANKQTVWVLFALVVAIGVTAWITQKNQNLQNKLAADAYYQLMQTAPVDGTTDSQENWKTFLPQVQTFLDKHEASDMAAPVMMLLAKANYANGNFEQAYKVYDQASQKLDPAYRYLAKEGAALSLQAQDQFDPSIKIFKTLSADELNPIRELHTWYLALAYQANKNNDKALETLQNFEKDFPSSPLLEKVKSQMVMLEPSL